MKKQPPRSSKTKARSAAHSATRSTKGAGRPAPKSLKAGARGRRSEAEPRKRGKPLREGGVKARGPHATEAAPAAPARDDLVETRELALAAMGAALDKKALMPVLIDVSSMASYTDFIGIVSGRSDRQVEAIAESVSQLMKSRGRHVLGHEGSGGGRWTLLDFGAIVIHVFYHPVREFYDLESLWIEAPRVKMDVPAEAMLPAPDALYETV